MKTQALCPICLKTLPAKKTRRGPDVFLERNCPQHGAFSTRIAKDANRFFDKTYAPVPKGFTPTAVFRGECGRDCGWCDAHRQHICTGLVEITHRCNLACPICYFGEKKRADLTPDEVEARIRTLLTVEGGHLDILQLSGGECTLHPQLFEIIDRALAHPITRVVLNTNGLALLSDETLFEKVRAHRDRMEIYLQFDGFDPDVYRLLRGRDLLAEKRALIEKLNAAGIKTTLAVTVCAANLTEIPAILRLSVATRHISGVTFQRLTKVGCAQGTPIESVFQEDILVAIERSGLTRYQDLIPLPCSHENCTTLGFLFCVGDQVYSLGEYLDYARVKPAISNRLAFDQSVLKYLREHLCDCFTDKLMARAGGLSREKIKSFTEGNASAYQDMKVVRLIVKNFMDADTFDFERARQCCTGVATGNGKVIPFCVHNTLKGVYP